MASRPASYLAGALAALALTASPAFATWSVIAVDQNSRVVAIASATCVPQAAFAGFPAKGLMDVQAIIVPGNDDITPAENPNPVKTLRMRNDAWKKAHPR